MGKRSKICFVSVDIESDLHCGKDKTFHGVNKVGAILALFKKHNVPATLFVSGEVIEKFPEAAKDWSADFEIGSHNYTHQSLSELSEKERVAQLDKFNEIYARVLGGQCAGFRAPRHVIDALELALLADKGFAYDSSIIPAYLPFKRYIGYKGRAPLNPYRPSVENQLKKGNLTIWELPLTPLFGGVPLSGVWLRYFRPVFFKFLTKFKKPNFLTLMMHSWDATDFSGKRSKNSGKVFLARLEKIIIHLKNRGYEFSDGRSIAKKL